MKGKPHLFLKAKEDLTDEQAHERGTMGEELPVLEAAWQLKEGLRTRVSHLDGGHGG